MRKVIVICGVAVVLVAVIVMALQMKESIEIKIAEADSLAIAMEDSTQMQYSYDDLEKLYHQADTVIRNADTLKIINTGFDTTIIETGIFTYLQYDYPLTTPREMVTYTRSALRWEPLKMSKLTEGSFQKVISYYDDERKADIEGFTDTNGLLQYEVNASILCSFAYEKTGSLDKAIETLGPFLANTEAWNSRIHERFIKLCITKYGKERVKQEFDRAGENLHKNNNQSPEYDDWVVTVFDAEIGVGDGEKDISATAAQEDINNKYFYKFVR